MASSKWLQILQLICLPGFLEFSYVGNAMKSPNVGHGSSQPNYPACGNYKVQSLTRLKSILGMCPHWDDETRSVYYTDAFGISVQRYFIDTGVVVRAQVISTSPIVSLSELRNFQLLKSFESPIQFLGFIIPTNVANQYAANYGDSLGVLSWDGRSSVAFFRKTSNPDPTRRFPFFVLFDGKVSPNGVLLFYVVPVPYGSLLPANPIQQLTPSNRSSLFGICGGKQKTLLTGFTFGNGIAFSPDGQWFYHDDSIRRIVYKSYFDQATCSIRNTSVLSDFGAKKIPGLPDGLTADNEGYVWIAGVTAGLIYKISPKTGDVVCAIKVPTTEVTDVTFGRCSDRKNGPLSCMYVTTGFVNSTRPTLEDGTLLLVSDFGAVGQLDKKANLKDITNSS